MCFSRRLYRLSLTDLRWAELPNSRYLPGSPSERAYHTSVYYDDHVFVLGGAYSDNMGRWYYYNGVLSAKRFRIK